MTPRRLTARAGGNRAQPHYATLGDPADRGPDTLTSVDRGDSLTRLSAHGIASFLPAFFAALAGWLVAAFADSACALPCAEDPARRGIGRAIAAAHLSAGVLAVCFFAQLRV